MINVFIDGQAGTTGLQLEQRLSTRDDIRLLTIDPALRKDPTTRLDLMNKADVIFLCLPDDEARKSAVFAPADKLVIDASPAHRVTQGWAYGMPELSHDYRNALIGAKRIAVPGCHAAGFISMIYPLLEAGLTAKDTKLCCNSLTGYSGGGRQMIEQYESIRLHGDKLSVPRPYALGLTHKHLPEMKAVCGLTHPPHFMPTVGDFYQGMFVTVQLWDLDLSDIHQAWTHHYKNSRFIRVMPIEESVEVGFMDITACNETNNIDLFVFGHETQVLLGARLDNLGKGASGAAVQCMNIALSLDEDLGLRGV
ncbi:MAG: N-acetyl-gamma-glutamyl-phosphate reductase [Defluviitaleaceae bacterium]|nr:N-acetyl-gamma-glutamyl-phosphate reductase [Defluviitaleaceae bacterium]